MRTLLVFWSCTAVLTLKNPTFCNRREVEFSCRSVVTTAFPVLAIRESTRIIEPTDWPVLNGPPLVYLLLV